MFWYYKRRKTFDGEAFWIFAMLYAVVRFFIEAIRDDERGEYFGMSTSQGIGVLLIALSFYMLSKLYRRSLAATEGQPSAAP